MQTTDTRIKQCVGHLHLKLAVITLDKHLVSAPPFTVFALSGTTDIHCTIVLSLHLVRYIFSFCTFPQTDEHKCFVDAEKQ